MKKERFCDMLRELSVALDILGEDKYKVQAYRRASSSIKASQLKFELDKQPESIRFFEEKLVSLPYVGKKIAAKAIEFINEGVFSEYERVFSKIPISLIELSSVQGLGPKKIRKLWKELGITSFDDLYRCLEDIDCFDRFKKLIGKEAKKIKENVEFLWTSKSEIPAWIVLDLLIGILGDLPFDSPGEGGVLIAGELRRGKETVSQYVPILYTSDTFFDSIIAKIRSNFKYNRLDESGYKIAVFRGGVKRDVVLRFIKYGENDRGWKFIRYTGSENHLLRLQEIASCKDPYFFSSSKFYGLEEKDIYNYFALPFIPPEVRESGEEIDMAADGALPPLVSIDDIVGDFHCHTNASDGWHDIEEVARLAVSKGLKVIAITDHSKSSFMANGLSEDRIIEHIKRIKTADSKIEGIKILAGAEVDILPDGSLDFGDDILSMLDIVVASPHFKLDQTPHDATARIIKAIKNRFTDIIGHPRGRILGKRKGIEIDIREIALCAKIHNVALELNSQWMRLDLDSDALKIVNEVGALVAINSDFHSRKDFLNSFYGVKVARRAMIDKKVCINCWSEDAVAKWLSRKNG